MLLDLREKVRNSKPIKYTLITLICIPFVLFGVGSYFSGGSAAVVAQVNGKDISQQQFDRAYQQQRQQLARMFGGQLPEAFANESLLREQALQQLITQQVLESEVAAQKFAVGDETLGRAIRNLPAFQVDGRFDSETYQNQLRASGLSVAAFEQSYRDDTALNQFRTGVIDTSFTLSQEATLMEALARQVRIIEGVRYSLEKAKQQVEISDEDITLYFSENQGEYQFPQRAKIQYLELSSSEIAAGIDVTDAEAQEYYNANRASYMLPEQREASHILLSLDDDGDSDELAEKQAVLTDLKTRTEAGESFADLAREFSDDVGSAELGGSLGVIAPGAMVPEFEQAVYGLVSDGEISEPVKTDFGLHLIKLDKVIAERGKSFEEVREEVISAIQNDRADREFFELREQLIELSFDNAGSLEPASEATGLEIKASDWLDSETQSGPVLSSPQVLAAIFSPDVLEEENNSELLEVGDRHVLVLRVLEHQGERPKSLEDVRDEVADTLREQRAADSLDKLAEAAVLQLAGGDSAASVAVSSELATAIEQVSVGRQSSEFDRAVVRQIFALPKPNGEVTTESAVMASGDRLVYRLDSVSTPEAPSDVEADDQVPGIVAEGANPRLGGVEFEVLLESLRAKADVDINISSRTLAQ